MACVAGSASEGSLYTPGFDKSLKGREYEQRALETGITCRMESWDGDQDHETNKGTCSFGFDSVVQEHPRRRRRVRKLEESRPCRLGTGGEAQSATHRLARDQSSHLLLQVEFSCAGWHGPAPSLSEGDRHILCLRSKSSAGYRWRHCL